MDANIKILREALNHVGNMAAWVAQNCNSSQTAEHMNDILAEIEAALSAPPRNCDVGSAEEQFRRYISFCRSRSREMMGDGCQWCPANRTKVYGTSNCDLAWAQMPYEAPAAQEGGDHADV